MKKLLIRILNKLKIIGKLNLTFTTIVNKQLIKIPLLKRVGIDNIYISEPWMIQLLEKIMVEKKDMAYIDVGVNIGQTLIKLKSVNPDVKYYGFEPNPICVNYLKELINTNKFNNVTIFPVGISDKTSIYELSFFTEGDTDSAASMVKDFRPNQKTYKKEYIACFNPSEIFNRYNIPPIGVLKIDVEGAEKEVIEGFKSKIIADQPFIQLEILPVYNVTNKERLARQTELENFFKHIGYTILRIHTDEFNKLASLEEIQTIGIHSNLKWCEYLIVPTSVKDNSKALF